MVRYFASHFIFLPEYGYFKQYVVGIEEGEVISAFPLTEEMEGVEWFPGVIAILDKKADIEGKGYAEIFLKARQVRAELPEACRQGLFPVGMKAYLLYPFDFTKMLPAAETRHRPLP